MGNKRARMSAEEVDFICGVRKDGKTHKDYNKATGRGRYRRVSTWQNVNS